MGKMGYFRNGKANIDVRRRNCLEVDQDESHRQRISYVNGCQQYAGRASYILSQVIKH